jgi:hypothetical protein
LSCSSHKIRNFLDINTKIMNKRKGRTSNELTYIYRSNRNVKFILGHNG